VDIFKGRQESCRPISLSHAAVQLSNLNIEAREDREEKF
jgi:hypothetical protein